MVLNYFFYEQQISQPVKKFPLFWENRNFLTVFQSAPFPTHKTLSQPVLILSTASYSTWETIHFANLILEELFITNLYQLDKQSTKFTIWKYWKNCVKRPEIFPDNSWILHHDNAPAHTALSVREFLATKQITLLEHPAYSPDLAPSDFFLFLKIKEILKGRYFNDIDDIRSNTTAALMTIPQNQFQNYFEGWSRRWHWCIASQGEYFEGDHRGI